MFFGAKFWKLNVASIVFYCIGFDISIAFISDSWTHFSQKQKHIEWKTLNKLLSLLKLTLEPRNNGRFTSNYGIALSAVIYTTFIIPA